LLSAALPREGQRSLSRALFFGGLIFGMADGWLNHDWAVDPAKASPWSVSILPGRLKDGSTEAWMLALHYSTAVNF